MITRITIQSETGDGPVSSAYKDRLTITRTSVRYEYEPMRPSQKNPPKKWTISSRDEEFESMFHNLCEEVRFLMNRPEKPAVRDATKTTFAVMQDDGKKAARTFAEGDDRYTICFTIVDQMIKHAGRVEP